MEYYSYAQILLLCGLVEKRVVQVVPCPSVVMPQVHLFAFLGVEVKKPFVGPVTESVEVVL